MYAPINGDLKTRINWWVPALSNATPSRALLKPQQPISVYCDAAGPGHVSFVLFFGSTRRVGRAHLPGWSCSSAGIYEFDLAIAISPSMRQASASLGTPPLVM